MLVTKLRQTGTSEQALRVTATRLVGIAEHVNDVLRGSLSLAS